MRAQNWTANRPILFTLPFRVVRCARYGPIPAHNLPGCFNLARTGIRTADRRPSPRYHDAETAEPGNRTAAVLPST